MENAKIKKIKTLPLHEIIIDQNFSSGKQICVLTLINMFSKMLLKRGMVNVFKRFSPGYYEAFVNRFC